MSLKDVMYQVKKLSLEDLYQLRDEIINLIENIETDAKQSLESVGYFK